MDRTGSSPAPDTAKSFCEEAQREVGSNSSSTTTVEEQADAAAAPPAEAVHARTFSDDSPGTNSTDSDLKAPRMEMATDEDDGEKDRANEKAAAADGAQVDEAAAATLPTMDNERDAVADCAADAEPTDVVQTKEEDKETATQDNNCPVEPVSSSAPAAADAREEAEQSPEEDEESAKKTSAEAEEATTVNGSGGGVPSPPPAPEEEDNEEQEQPSGNSSSSDSDDEEEDTAAVAVVEVAPVATDAVAADALPPAPHSPARAAAVAPELSDPPQQQQQQQPPSLPATTISEDSSGAKPIAASPTSPSSTTSGPSPSSGASAQPSASATSSAVVPLLLLSLPVDSLHCIASFLTPEHWSNLGLTSRGANLACKEVFRRVRMHGFRCATEVVTAWARGEHADARELAALYIKSGVPIYPLCLGHSYQTLTWRMGVEAREMDSSSDGQGSSNREGNANAAAAANNNGNAENPADGGESGDNDGSSATQPQSSKAAAAAVKLDRFYTERHEARTQDGYYFPSMTYLEEKCLFWKHRDDSRDGDDILSPERRRSLTDAISLRPPPAPMPGVGAYQQQPMGGPGGPAAAHLPPRIPGFPDLPHLAAAQAQQAAADQGGLPAGAAADQQPTDPFLRAHHALAFSNAAAAGAGGGQPFQQQRGLPSPPRRTMSSSNLTSPYPNQKLQATPRRPKMSVRIHKHLADHHLLGQRAVNDEEGSMKTAPLSLSVDFFHPHLHASTTATAAVAAVYPSDMMSSPYAALSSSSAGGLPQMTSRYHAGYHFGPAAPPTPIWGGPQWTPTSVAGAASAPGGDATEVPVAAAPPSALPLPQDAPTAQQPQQAMTLHQQVQGGAPGNIDLNAAAAGLVPPPLFGGGPLPRIQHAVSFGPGPVADPNSAARSITGENPIVTDVSLEVYSSSSSGLPKAGSRDENSSGCDSNAGKKKDLRNLRSRFASYQRKLDSHLSHYQSSAFDECLLDFWDEFLALTAGVHYYDGHTPVPRMASLHRFLTSPCPKSLGIVQCEIERIKISSKKKGVNVKGRLFPSYEYRLFIRDRRHGSSESQTAPTDGPPRSDTVLMTAMNKGKNHLGVAGVSPAASSSKRGVNNYYIFMPQQSDVDMHFKSVNDPSVLNNSSNSTQPRPFQKLSPIGSGGSSPFELGRLQSNFIGTEFQIFSPCIKKQKPPALNAARLSRSEDSLGGDSSDNEFDRTSEVSRDTSESVPTSTPSPRRGSGFRRRLSSSRRSLSRGRSHSRRSLSRGRSRRGSNSVTGDADDVSVGSTPGRTRRGSWPALRPSRRAIANSIDTPSGQEESCQPVMGEEENGVITYTANLLGNRPRIMDVCIPKVSEDGVVAPDWRRHCESSSSERDDDKAESMMSKFKQLQQQMDSPEGGNNENPADSHASPSDFGLTALQNRPPWWNVELGAFVLNFGGRVSVASVKNFQLCDRGDQEHIMLQFGRIQGRHSFTMDFQYPLSATQAFAIAISSLQSKISFG